MNTRSVYLVITVGALLFNSIPAYGNPADPLKIACDHNDDQVGLGKNHVDHLYDKCKSTEPDDNRLQNFETWSDEDEQPRNNNDNVVRKPKYHIRDFDECLFGNENHSNCYVNPDVAPCPDGSLPLTRQIYTDDQLLVRQYRYCPGDPLPNDLPEDLFVEEIRIDLKKFRSFPIKGSEIQSAPNKFSLRNGHTHFWASENTQEFNSNLSGSNVRIKAIPIQWNWNYGDGATRNLSFPGEAMPSHTLHDETATSHSYSETGKFGVRVTTLYRGEFSVDGGPWQAIPGQAAVPSNTLPIDVWRTKKELIAND